MRTSAVILLAAIVCAATSAALAHGATQRVRPSPYVLRKDKILPDGYVSTRFGDFHPSCVLELPEGALVREVPADPSVGLVAGVAGTALQVEYADGSTTNLPGCQYETRYNARTAAALKLDTPDRAGEVGMPVSWGQWTQHLWFGTDVAPFTNPSLPAPVQNMSAAWTVPPEPNTKANASSPWPSPQTMSLWPGLQGGAVLQPVLEWNDLLGATYDMASWNCCPAGAVVHGPPYSVSPGEALSGSVVRQGDTKTFTITTVAGSKTSTLMADMSNVAGWTGDWVEYVNEAYYISECTMLWPPMTFTDVKLLLEGGKVMNGCDAPYQQTYIALDPSQDGHPVCGGKATCTGGDITIMWPGA